MRKLVVGLYTSLDGVIENPMWTMPYWNDEIAHYNFEQLSSSDGLLLGRKTYQGFAEAWTTDEHAKWMTSMFSSLPDPTAYSKRMNSFPKYVVSNTLKEAEWNNSTIISGNVMENIKQLKNQPGREIGVTGSGELIRSLVAHGLIDEFRLTVYPIALGQGTTLFSGIVNQLKLKLLETLTFSSGVLVLKYAVEPS
jgi:dihydrofolate reductase